MRRRGIGLGRTGIVGGSKNKRKPLKDRFEALGKKMEDKHINHIQEQMTLFKTKLEEFANKHKRTIREDPVFRRQFQQMCSKIGVDPLASNKGVWAKLGVSSITLLICALSERIFFVRVMLACLYYLGGVNNIIMWTYNIELVHMKTTNILPYIPKWFSCIIFMVAYFSCSSIINPSHWYFVFRLLYVTMRNET